MELDLAADLPPPGLAPALAALWWLKKGALRPGAAWERAHAICQSHEGQRDTDLVHGLAHWIEGDLGNADYWYRRAGSLRGGAIAADWARIAAELGAEPPAD
ncbi:MAG TPA: hypothetical protein VM891_03400 [Amaricoccus sp.]|jgi:triacylglycerol esterase/lipase EstA (alpha/beta hydrolase family)|nr:hypothetical protein [Amaricoccus sp.]